MDQETGYETIKKAVLNGFITAVECRYDVGSSSPEVHLDCTESCPDDLAEEIESFLWGQIYGSVPDDFQFSGSFGVDDQGRVYLDHGRVESSGLENHFRESYPGWKYTQDLIRIEAQTNQEELVSLCAAIDKNLDASQVSEVGILVHTGHCKHTVSESKVMYDEFTVFLGDNEVVKNDEEIIDVLPEGGFKVVLTDELRSKIPGILSRLDFNYDCGLTYFNHTKEKEWEGYHSWEFGFDEDISESWYAGREYL